MTSPADVRAAQQRLLRELGELAGAVARTAPGRCPYRDAADRCTFGAGCRNRLRAGPGQWRCSGAALQTLPSKSGQPT